MNYENLSKELKINIQSFLDYETMISISMVNKEHNNLYKEINENKYFETYSTKKYYINKNSKNVHNFFFTSLFIQIISYNNDNITYKYIKYGNYNNYRYPISNIFLYILSHDLVIPLYNQNLIISKEEFNKNYEIYKKSLFDNNKSVYIKFILQSIMMYIFFYIPILFIIIASYSFYYLFFIMCIIAYAFHMIIMCEILLTSIVSRNVTYI